MKDRSIWVVEKGEYSDYGVVGVFSSKENAQQIADVLNQRDEDGYRGEEATIAEWTLDPAINELRKGYSQFLIHMREDGTVERAYKRQMASYNLSGDVQIWRRSTAPAYAGKNATDLLSATVWAKDEAHAIKIANEHRTRMIATGEWHSEK